MQPQPSTCEPWPGFFSNMFGGQKMSPTIVQTFVGTLAAARMKKITLKIQSIGGKIWVSDDAFKRCMRVNGPTSKYTSNLAVACDLWVCLACF